MKKVAGIISLIGCCVGIVLCSFLIYKTNYLGIKEQEEIIGAKGWKLRERQRELESKEWDLRSLNNEEERLREDFREVLQLIKQGYYTHYESETLSQRKNRLSKELDEIISRNFDLRSEIASIKNGQYSEYFGDVEIWEYREDSIKGIEIAIDNAQSEIERIRERALEVILKNLIGISILVVGICYVIATRFGSIEPTVLRHLERENDFIRKRIEKIELLVKLENIGRK